MSKPFDAILNDLIDLRPGDWAAEFARIAGLPPGPATSLDTDLATTVQADKVFRIDGSPPSILHLELEANPRLGIPRELMRYNTLVDHRYDLPVATVLVLLRPKAAASDQTGVYERIGADGRRIAEFRYHVERVWQRPAAFWLAGGPALSPLAMLTKEAEGDLDLTLTRVRDTAPGDGKLAKDVLHSTFVLCGLLYHQDQLVDIFRRYSMLLEESTTYQWIIQQGMAKGIAQGAAEGRAEGKRDLILRQGTKRFGPPTADASAALQAINDPDALEALGDRILDATGWDDLFAQP